MSRLIWHRRDMRLLDNELYHHSCCVYSLFIFDPSDFAPRPTGIFHDGSSENELLGITHGPHYTRRLIDAVHSLRYSLRRLGGELIVRIGNPLVIIPNLLDNELHDVNEVAWSEISGQYECVESTKLKDILCRDGRQCKVYTTCSHTLYHPNDLPKDCHVWQQLARPNEKRTKKEQRKSNNDIIITTPAVNSLPNITNVDGERFVGMPRVMGDFRRVARSYASVRALFVDPTPQSIGKIIAGMDVGYIPSLDELMHPLLETTTPLLGCISQEMIQNLVESARQLHHQYEFDYNLEDVSITNLRNFIRNHASTVNRSLCDVSNDQSSKLSVSLSLGILSPRQVYHCVKNHEMNDQLENINWIISHMEMRDYFLYESFRNGSNAYRLQPSEHPEHKPNIRLEWVPLSRNVDAFIHWTNGTTNLPLVDAGMKELVTTGYISNRVRQNVTSLLTKDLKLDWRLGAEFFQLCLEDHCPAANYGNWAYFAGVGGDPKNRHFRTISQACRYDPDGAYVRKWINDRFSLIDTVIEKDDVEIILRPWDFLTDWSPPIVPPDTQLTWQDRERLEKFGKIR